MNTYRCTVTCQYLGRLWSPGELLESEAVPPSHFAPLAVQMVPEEAENRELREENQELREKIRELEERLAALTPHANGATIQEILEINPDFLEQQRLRALVPDEGFPKTSYRWQIEAPTQEPEAGQAEAPAQQEQVEVPAQGAVQEAEPEKRGRTAAKK